MPHKTLNEEQLSVRLYGALFTPMSLKPHSVDSVRALLQEGASASEQPSSGVRSGSRWLPLAVLISRHDHNPGSQETETEIMRLLLEHGASPSETDPNTGKSLLALASLQGKDHLVALLLEHGAHPDKGQALSAALLGVRNNTGLQRANNIKVIKRLLNAGARTDTMTPTKDYQVRYLQWFLVEAESFVTRVPAPVQDEVAALMVEAGADVLYDPVSEEVSPSRHVLSLIAERDLERAGHALARRLPPNWEERKWGDQSIGEILDPATLSRLRSWEAQANKEHFTTPRQKRPRVS